MRKILFAMIALVACGAVAADERRPVALPDEAKAALLAEMRSHVENLDDMLRAVAAGEFRAAGEIAEIRIDAGHEMWERMKANGMSMEAIRQAKAAFKAAGGGPGRMPAMPMPGHAPGGGQPRTNFARLMPPEFIAMGEAFHLAGQAFAAEAAKAASPPTADDYRRVTSALQGVTNACRTCHATFRVR